MNLTAKEIGLILEALSKVYGFGYSTAPGVGALQAKLSIMLEVKQNSEAAKGGRDE